MPVASSEATVTVACKLPHGLLLRIFDIVDDVEPQKDGSTKDIKKAMARPNRVLIKGYLQKYKPGQPLAAVGSSFALTHGVPKAFFEEWLKQNSRHPAVVNHLIFASEKADAVEGKIRELDNETRSGLEPIDPSRLPKGIASFKANDQAA